MCTAYTIHPLVISQSIYSKKRMVLWSYKLEEKYVIMKPLLNNGHYSKYITKTNNQISVGPLLPYPSLHCPQSTLFVPSQATLVSLLRSSHGVEHSTHKKPVLPLLNSPGLQRVQLGHCRAPRTLSWGISFLNKFKLRK